MLWRWALHHFSSMEVSSAFSFVLSCLFLSNRILVWGVLVLLLSLLFVALRMHLQLGGCVFNFVFVKPFEMGKLTLISSC